MSSYTEQDLERVQRARATGAQSVEIGGKKIVYQSPDALARLEERIRRDLGLAGTPSRSVILKYVRS